MIDLYWYLIITSQACNLVDVLCYNIQGPKQTLQVQTKNLTFLRLLWSGCGYQAFLPAHMLGGGGSICFALFTDNLLSVKRSLFR